MASPEPQKSFTILSYEELFKEEMKPELKGYEKGQETELGAVNVMTKVYIQDVLPKISSSLKTKTPRTLYGGLPMSTRTTTIDVSGNMGCCKGYR